VATAWATAGVCTTTVFFVPVESQPAAFPTTRTEMPPITAATIATIAIGTGRSRTARTVAACVLGLGAENSLELDATYSAEPGSQRVGCVVSVLTLGDPHPNWLSNVVSRLVRPVNGSASHDSRKLANGFLIRHAQRKAEAPATARGCPLALVKTRRPRDHCPRMAEPADVKVPADVSFMALFT
jgi:hypothetical protein